MLSNRTFKQLLAKYQPVQIAGVFNAYTALAATQVGHKALYLSGATVTSESSGLPSDALKGVTELVELARQITDTTDVPLLVDINSGLNGSDLIHAIRSLQRAGVAAVHINDQEPFNARGGWVSKPIISKRAMLAFITMAVEARSRSDLYIVAHTDAFAQEGLHAAIDRAADYVKAGADAIYVESAASLSDYQNLTDAIGVPVIAKVNALGKNPLFRPVELEAVGVSMIVHPMTGFENATGAMQHAYQALLDSCGALAAHVGMPTVESQPQRWEAQLRG